jgi:hypothetical protein
MHLVIATIPQDCHCQRLASDAAGVLSKYRKSGQIFDFAGAAAYNAAGSIQLRPVFIGFVEFDAEIGTLFPIKSLNLPEPALTILSLTQT